MRAKYRGDPAGDMGKPEEVAGPVPYLAGGKIRVYHRREPDDRWRFVCVAGLARPLQTLAVEAR